MNKNLLIFRTIKKITKILPVRKLQLFNSEITLICHPKNLKNILSFLKNHVLCQFKILTCISGIDYLKKKNRFKIVYELLSIRFNIRCRVVCFVDELVVIDSITSLYSAAGWFECEIWDMFGVFFKNHSNLKRLLTDYGFEGFPLRKDFPLSGFVEMRYNEVNNRVVSESIELSQEYRAFRFISPWEN